LKHRRRSFLSLRTLCSPDAKKKTGGDFQKGGKERGGLALHYQEEGFSLRKKTPGHSLGNRFLLARRVSKKKGTRGPLLLELRSLREDILDFRRGKKKNIKVKKKREGRCFGGNVTWGKKEKDRRTFIPRLNKRPTAHEKKGFKLHASMLGGGKKKWTSVHLKS